MQLFTIIFKFMVLTICCPNAFTLHNTDLTFPIIQKQVLREKPTGDFFDQYCEHGNNIQPVRPSVVAVKQQPDAFANWYLNHYINLGL